MTPDKIARLRELSAKAKPGTWRWLSYTFDNKVRKWFYCEPDSEQMLVSNLNVGDEHVHGSDKGFVAQSASTGYGGETEIFIDKADAELICEMRNSLDELLDENEKLIKVAGWAKRVTMESDLLDCFCKDEDCPSCQLYAAFDGVGK